jgi:hypothetical protein
MSIAQQVFTNAGKSMLGRAQHAETLNVSKIVIGSGGASQPSDIYPLTQLIVQELLVNITAQRDYGDGTLLVEGSFLSSDAPHAFDLREVGVLAHVGGEADRLYSAANCFNDPPDHVDPASPSVYTFKIKLIIDRIPEAQVIVQIGPSENMIGTNIGADTVGPGFYKDTQGNVMRFKRVKQGFGIVITDEGDDVKFDVQAFTLQNDLDLYVPSTYPGQPPELCFPTVQAAHDHLLQYSIPTDKFARIHVYKGVFSQASTIVFSHPHCSQISLIGWPHETYNVDASGGITYIDSTHKKVTLAVGTVMTNFAVGDCVYLKRCHTSWSGGCRVTAINTVTRELTLTIHNRSALLPYSTHQAIAGMQLVRFPTILKCTADLTNDWGIGNLSFPYGMMLVQDIASDGGYAGFGFGAYPAAVEYCMAIHHIKGFASAGPLAFYRENCATDCDFGVSASPMFAPEETYINACGAGILGEASIAGYFPPNPAYGYPVTLCYLTHCHHGGRIWGAVLNCGAMFFTNNDVGFHTNIQGSVNNGPWGSQGAQNTIDLYATGMSFMWWNRAGGGVPSSSPAADAYGTNMNSFIHVENFPLP